MFYMLYMHVCIHLRMSKKSITEKEMYVVLQSDDNYVSFKLPVRPLIIKYYVIKLRRQKS